MELGDVTLSHLSAQGIDSCIIKNTKKSNHSLDASLGEHIVENILECKLSVITITYFDPTKTIAVRISPTIERDAPIYVSIVNPGWLGGSEPILGWIAYEINNLDGYMYMCGKLYMCNCK